MTWLSIAIVAYLLYALAAAGDKALLAGSFKNPATYATFVGVGGLIPFIILVIFIGVPLPSTAALFAAVVSGALFIVALLPYYRGIQEFEVSRIVPATGGLVPFFTLLIGLLFLPQEENLSLVAITSFTLLIAGSVLLSRDRERRISARSFRLALFASSLFALSFVLLKYAYLLQPFWSGLLWVQVGSATMGLVFLATFRSVHEDVRRLFGGRKAEGGANRRTVGLFLATQGTAAAAAILQHAAFFLASATYFAFVNALQGTQYLFLFILALALSARYPHLFHEERSQGTIAQKLIGIFLVISGLVVLAFV